MRNNVRGPTSALSSFLREKGIRIDAGRNRDQEQVIDERIVQENPEIDETLNVDETVDQIVAEPIQINNEPVASSSSSREKKKGKQKKRKLSNDFPLPAPKKGTNVNFCRRCCRRFLHDNQIECIACLGIKKSGQSSKKSKKVVNQDGEKVKFLSLRDLCLKIVAEYIDYVEEFGDISENSKLLISKIISRQRQINNSTIKLFLGPAEKMLKLFDCTLINSAGYEMISYLCPNLTSLHLGMCGRIRDSDIKILVDGCPNLTIFELDGPFLCTDDGMSEVGRLSYLESLSISNASKITYKSINNLKVPLRLLKLRHCTAVDKGIGEVFNIFPNLEDLKLEFIGNLSEDELILIIQGGKTLHTLFLEGFSNLTDNCLQQICKSCPSLSMLSVGSSEQLTNEGLLAFFEALTISLSYLSLHRVTNLADDVLISVLSHHSKTLTHLDLNGLDKLTSESLNALSGIRNLKYIDLSWIRNVDNELFDSLRKHCSYLNILKVYGCIRLTDENLNLIWTNDNGQTIQIQGNEFD